MEAKNGFKEDKLSFLMADKAMYYEIEDILRGLVDSIELSNKNLKKAGHEVNGSTEKKITCQYNGHNSEIYLNGEEKCPIQEPEGEQESLDEEESLRSEEVEHVVKELVSRVLSMSQSVDEKKELLRLHVLKHGCCFWEKTRRVSVDSFDYFVNSAESIETLSYIESGQIDLDDFSGLRIDLRVLKSLNKLRRLFLRKRGSTLSNEGKKPRNYWPKRRGIVKRHLQLFSQKDCSEMVVDLETARESLRRRERKMALRMEFEKQIEQREMERSLREEINLDESLKLLRRGDSVKVLMDEEWIGAVVLNVAKEGYLVKLDWCGAEVTVEHCNAKFESREEEKEILSNEVQYNEGEVVLFKLDGNNETQLGVVAKVVWDEKQNLECYSVISSSGLVPEKLFFDNIVTVLTDVQISAELDKLKTSDFLVYFFFLGFLSEPEEDGRSNSLNVNVAKRNSLFEVDDVVMVQKSSFDKKLRRAKVLKRFMDPEITDFAYEVEFILSPREKTKRTFENAVQEVPHSAIKRACTKEEAENLSDFSDSESSAGSLSDEDIFLPVSERKRKRNSTPKSSYEPKTFVFPSPKRNRSPRAMTGIQFKVGDRVMPRPNCSVESAQHLISVGGTVTAVRNSTLCSIQMDTGERFTSFPMDMLMILTRPRGCFEIGEKVEANFEEDGEWYPGVIGFMNNHGKYRVEYNDGDVESGVSSKNIRYGRKRENKKRKLRLY